MTALISDRQSALRRRQAPHVEKFAVRVGAGDLWTNTATIPKPKHPITGWDPSVTGPVPGSHTVVVLGVARLDERRLSTPNGALLFVVEDEAGGEVFVAEYVKDIYATLWVVPAEARRDPWAPH